MTTASKSQAGMTIGTVLLLVTVAALALFTMVAMAFFHLRFSTVVVDQRSARNLAESALATALTEIWNDPSYGKGRGTGQFFHIESESGDEAEAFLSFNQGKANEFDIPFSTNNFEASASTLGGNGRTVPDSVVHLVAVGKCRESSYSAEMLYYIPPYPNALASSGPIQSTGGLLVAGIPSTQELRTLNGAGEIQQDRLEPGHIVSNSSNKDAISMGAGSEIRGDVIAVGGIQLDSSVNVLGEVRPNSSAQSVPELAIGEVFNKLTAVVSREKISVGLLTDDTTIDYFTEATSTLTIQGDLVLDGGVLYCRDDLEVWGEVRGHGAVFSLGDVKINSGADLTATDQVALVARGSMELYGNSKKSQFFNGLVYSEKEILAENITIIGAAVVNGDKNSLLRLDNVNLIKSPISTSLVIGLPQDNPIPQVNNIPTDSKDGTKMFGTQEKTTVSPPNIRQILERTLAGALRASAVRLPDAEGKPRFSVLLESVFGRPSGPINSLADLTAEELASIQLDDHEYSFVDGHLYVRATRLNNVTAEEAVEAAEIEKQRLQDRLPDPIDFEVQTKGKKKFFFFTVGKEESTVQETFDPASGVASFSMASYLSKLEKPTETSGANLIDLTLNRVFDPTETSNILLWKSF